MDEVKKKNIKIKVKKGQKLLMMDKDTLDDQNLLTNNMAKEMDGRSKTPNEDTFLSNPNFEMG